jgi:hypothetical protein
VFTLKTIFFSRTSRPISHPWLKRIKDCSKEGPGSFPRRDNHRNAKIGWNNFEIFSRTTEPEVLIFT